MAEASGVDVVAAILSLSRDWPADVTSLWHFLHGEADSWLGLERVLNLNLKLKITLNLIISNLNLKLNIILNHEF